MGPRAVPHRQGMGGGPKDAMLGHQSGRSLLDVVFLQAMHGDAGMMDAPEEREHSGAYLWDLSIFMSTSQEELCSYRPRSKATTQRCSPSR